MKGRFFTSLRFLLVSLFISHWSLAHPVSAQEKINSFAAAITVDQNASVVVSERIEYDFGENLRHGIFRTIPTVKTNAAGDTYRLIIENIAVIDDRGDAYPFTTTTTGKDITIKIGDPAKQVSGNHTYQISYTVRGALTYFSDHDELYWNVTGNGWKVPIDTAQAVLNIPPGSTQSAQLACYTGKIGSTAKDCIATTDQRGGLVKSTASLAPAEGLTVVLGFPKGLVAVVEPEKVTSFFETGQGSLALIGIGIGGLLWYLLLPIFIVIVWYRNGRDPKVPGPVTAWYDPPKDANGRFLTPAESGTLIDETADERDISALLVDLARRGYLKIVEKKKEDFTLVKGKEADNTLVSYEQHFLDGLFKDKTEVSLKNVRLYKLTEETKDNLYDQVMADGFFAKNPKNTRNLYYGLGGAAIFTLNIPLAIVCFTYGRFMPKKTLLGAQAAVLARSMKNFLSSQDRQLEFQAQNQLFFEKLLPYAVAFGVEKVWAKRFESITMAPPDWYEGHNTAFSSVILVNSLSHSFQSVQAASTPPTSPSSGFSSGFSGGFSGGGGGGGGGGSW